MKYFAVIDTNVIVSSMLKKESIPGQIMDYVDKGIIVPLVNEEILEEYVEVITRNKFNFEKAAVELVMGGIEKRAIFVEREKTLEELIDKDNVVFFEIVLSARSTMDAYLVTGNMKHYPIRSYVVTPSQMIEIIEKDSIKENPNNL